MSIQLPDALAPILAGLGFTWPTADEDVLRANADIFARAGASVASAVEEVDESIETLDASNSPDFSGHYVEFLRSEDSNVASLRDFAEAMDIIADSFTEVADALVACKATIIRQLQDVAAANGADVDAVKSRAAAIIEQVLEEATALATGEDETDEEEPEQG